MTALVERRTAKVTHVSLRDSFVDTFAFEADARKRFAEYKTEQGLIWAALHVREGRTYRLVEIHDNTEDLELGT